MTQPQIRMLTEAFRKYYAQYHIWPTYAELGSLLGLSSKASVKRWVDSGLAAGAIVRKAPSGARTIGLPE